MWIRKSNKYINFICSLLIITVYGVKKDQSKFFEKLSKFSFPMTSDPDEADLYFTQLREYIKKNPKFLEENKEYVNTFCKKTGLKL